MGDGGGISRHASSSKMKFIRVLRHFASGSWFAQWLLQIFQQVITHLKHDLLTFRDCLSQTLGGLFKMGWDSHFGEFTDSAEEKHIVFQQESMVTSQTSSRSFSASYFFQPFARSRLIKSLLLSILSPPDLKFLDDNGLYCRLCPVQCTGSLPSGC